MFEGVSVVGAPRYVYAELAPPARYRSWISSRLVIRNYPLMLLA